MKIYQRNILNSLKVWFQVLLFAPLFYLSPTLIYLVSVQEGITVISGHLFLIYWFTIIYTFLAWLLFYLPTFIFIKHDSWVWRPVSSIITGIILAIVALFFGLSIDLRSLKNLMTEGGMLSESYGLLIYLGQGVLTGGMFGFFAYRCQRRRE